MISSEVNAVRWTSKDLEGFPDNGIKYEIIDGELFRTQMPHLHHQMVMGNVCFYLNIWSDKTGLGKAVFCPGIIFSESNDVIPDVVWISHKRLAQLLDDDGHLRGAPELVVEVLSMLENEKKQDQENKLKLYSVQGVREYWMVDYQQREIEIYRRHQARLEKAVTLFEQDTLTSPLLPEFECAVEEIITTL